MTRQLCFCALLVLSISPRACPPWTIRRIDSRTQTTPQTSTVANPVAYVDSIWDSKLIPTVMSSAVDARVLLDLLRKSPEEAQNRYGHHQSGSAIYFIIRGEGRVIAVNTSSRAGVLLLDVPPFDGRPDVAIQIGPVLRGTSLRDATGLVQFTDFSNQLQFADAGNELNDRVLKMVLSSLNRSTLAGARVSFAGTGVADTNAQPPLREIIPVQLKVEGR